MLDTLIFAPLAPLLGVLLFWFIQLLFIESHKFLLSKIRYRHEPLCRFTNFTGILFQTICHGLGYSITMSGISHFSVNVDYGRVIPKRERKGIFEWISNSFLFLGPFFFPPFILLVCLLFLIEEVEMVKPLNYTFSEGLINFGINLFNFSQKFLSFLSTLDLSHPAHLGFLFLLIFLGMGIRPSYIGREEKKKVDMIYDLRNIKSLILNRPLYPLVLFLVSYIFFYISYLLQNNWHLSLFSILGWLSIISIVSLLLAHSITALVRVTDNIRYRVLPLLIIPLSYILARIFFFFHPIAHSKSISLLIMVLSPIIVIIFLRCDKLKTMRKYIP